MTLKIQPLGDRALLCEASAPAGDIQQRRIWALADIASRMPNVDECVPGVNNLLVLFEPLSVDLPALTARIERAWQDIGELPAESGKLVEVPVVYGGAAGPDLDDVARHAGMSREQVVELHGAIELVALCIGFQPGFAYLGGLDPRLSMPRRATPRTAVPAGSVAIAGLQSAIYPARSPGGWNLIGHTDVTLFDPAAQPPTLLAAGDRVRFRAIRIDA